MKRNEQLKINADVCVNLSNIADELSAYKMPVARLRTCSADVFETEHWYVLYSYRTPVAAVHKESRMGYDFLRLVYGYTATSAQHIAKFFHDYGVRGVGGSGLEMRWAEC